MTVNTTLTPRESEVLDMICQGYRYKEVAENLNIKRSTVAKHVQNMYMKHGCKSVAQLITKMNVKGVE